MCREVFIEACRYYSAKRKIKKEIKEERRGESVEKYADAATNLSDQRIKYHERLSRDRRKSIRDKAENNVLGVTIAVSILSAGAILGSGSSNGVESISIWEFVPVFLFSMALLYFLLGGRYAFNAMNVGKVYRISPEKEATYSEKEISARRLWYLNLNKKETILRTNALDVSFTSIRNGIISLVLAILSTLLMILPI